ncbi:MAG: DUF1246 domain-containing protein, partial [Saccharolobus sp.]
MIIATIGSHSALQIMHGGKKENFKTAIITDELRVKFYKNFNFIDVVLPYNDLNEALTQINSLEQEGILIPHGSLVEYLGKERVEKIKT